jgi:hydrogenase expression/formation protein HypE
MNHTVTLAHGSGGKPMHELIEKVFARHLSNDLLKEGDDGARFYVPAGRLAFSTDSYVISPLFFRGGNIGKLAVCGTVNDLSASGAIPKYLSCGFIIEEGFPMEQLEEIAASMAETARESGVLIVTGDTKVVPKGAADKLFINTSGIGLIPEGVDISGHNAKPGDKILVTGNLGDHGCAILLEREQLGIRTTVKSDCAPLAGMVRQLLDAAPGVHVLRDPTRGGLATTLNEIAQQSGVGMKLLEDALPIREETVGICSMLGLDPLYMANEGKMVVIVDPAEAGRALEALKAHDYGRDACIIGEVTAGQAGRVYIETIAGGSRILDMLQREQLPRIC